MKTKMTCIVVMATLAMISSQVFAATVLNGSFELPTVTDRTNFTGVTNSWDYSGGSFQAGLINSNNATFCPSLAAAEGDQFAFVWCGADDEIAQNVSGFISNNTYAIMWSEAARAATAAGNLWVLMDSVTICASHSIPNDETWRSTNVNFTATKTTHRLRFYHGGAWDTMTFIDDVKIIPEPAVLGLLALVGLAFLRRK